MIIPCAGRSLNYLPSAVESIQKNGLAIEIWEITPLLNRRYHDLQLTENFDFKFTRVFKEKKELLKALENLDAHCIVNCFVGLSIESLFIYRALAKQRLRYCGLQMAGLPNPIVQNELRPSSFLHLFRRVSSLNISDIVNHMLNKFIFENFHRFGVRAPDALLLAGEKSLEGKSYPIDEHTTLIWAHSFDYDKYIQIRDLRPIIDTPYCLFLDEYLPFHPDWLDMGIDSMVAADDYYPKMCQFFDYIEREFQIPVIIAAHPKSAYNHEQDFFSGRTIIKGQTACLVKDAAFVIAHDSTSINFAVLFKKPIFFTTMDKFLKLKTGKYIPGLLINKIASELNREPINIDHLDANGGRKDLRVDIDAYDTYISNYIKKRGSPELPFWDIFLLFCQRRV